LHQAEAARLSKTAPIGKAGEKMQHFFYGQDASPVEKLSERSERNYQPGTWVTTWRTENELRTIPAILELAWLDSVDVGPYGIRRLGG